jgi:hypothetical protein
MTRAVAVDGPGRGAWRVARLGDARGVQDGVGTSGDSTVVGALVADADVVAVDKT